MTGKDSDSAITVSVHVGNVTLSFETDLAGSNIESMTRVVRKLLSAHREIWKLNVGGKGEVPAQKVRNSSRKGKAETSVITRRIEDTLVPEGYFNEGRKTGDVLSELKKRFHVRFTSRKISQALGELYGRGILSRIGGKGKFVYLHLG